MLMHLALRPVALLAVCGLALACTACGSSNKDKIVGKWKVEGGSKGAPAELADKMFPYMEFAKDGTFKVGLEVTDPAVKEKMGMFADGFVVSGKYNVSGDTLELLPTDGKDKSRPSTKGDNKGKIKFEGNDKLTLTGPDGDAKTLTRVK